MTTPLEDLQAKLPDPLKPWAAQYGPVVLAWSAADFKAWLDKLIAGDVYSAYADILKVLGNQAATDNWATIQAGWTAANAENLARKKLATEALVGLLKIVLAIALAAFGL